MGIMLTKKITRMKRILARLFAVMIIVSSIGNHTIRAYAAEEVLLEEASLEADRIAAEQAAAQAEAERIAAEQAAAAQAEAEAQAIAEAERIAQEQAEAAALAEAERFAEEQAEAERIAQEQAQAEAGVQENTDPVYDDNVGDGTYNDTETVNEEYQESVIENEITEEEEPGMTREEEFRVTIFYEASEGGSVSTAEETITWKEIATTDAYGNTTFTQEPEFVTVQGSTAQADEDYEFTGWSLNGEIVSGDESFVPAPPAADVVYQAQFTQKEETYPAQSWEDETRDVFVSASVEEGVFPEGTTMHVAPVRKQEAIAAAQDMVGEDTAVVDAVAVDITFRDKNDQEIQPNGVVNVHLTPKKKLQGESHDAITIDETGAASVVEDADADENGSDIVTEHFTVYGVIGTEVTYDDSVTQHARHTYKFHAGAPTADPASWPVVDTRIVRDGDTLTLPTNPAGDAKHTFAGWFKADAEGNLTDEEVTEGEIKIESAENAQNTQAKDETIEVYAQFSTKFEITLYTDDKKTTVYETHLRDAGKSVTPLPQKDDDDFDLHIADGSDFIGWKIDGTDDKDIVNEVTIDAEHPEDIDLVPVFASINQVKFEVNPASQEGVATTKIPTQNVPVGGTVSEPHAFEKDKEYNGYEFLGWFDSCELNEATGEYKYGAEWDFSTVVEKNTILYAKWEPKTVTFRVEIHQEKQDVVGEYALKFTASASETESYGFKGMPGELIDEAAIERILQYNQQKRTEKFHLSRTGVTDDTAKDPYAVEIWQDDQRVAEYDAVSGAFVSGAEDATISGKGTTVVKVYESRDTYHIHFLFRDGNTGQETYNATGYTTVKDDHKQFLPDGLDEQGTLAGQVYEVRFKDNMHRTVYLNEVNPQNGADNTVIQKLMDAGWYFNTDYFRKEGGQTVFNHTNKTYNLNPRPNMTDGMDVVCRIYYDPDMVPHPFVFRYYTPDRKSYEERGNTTILYSVKDNNKDGKPDNPHSHEYTLFAESAGYKLVKIESGTKVYTSKNINPANGKEQYIFEYDGMTAKPLVLHYEPVAKTITFDPQDGETASFRAVNGAWPAIADQNAFYYGDSYADTVNDPDGAGRYKAGDTKVFENGVVMRFDGWYNNKNGTGEPFDFTDKTMTGSNLTFYGKWTPVECKVIFHPNNGEDNTEQNVTVGTRANRIPNPVKPGETFGGWHLDDGTFEKRYDFGTVLDLETVAKLETGEGSKEIHLYAMWNSKQSYTVVYHKNGGEFAASLQSALNAENEDTEKYRGGASASVKGAAQKAAAGSLQYVFTGWAVGNAQSDVVLQSGEPFAANSANDLKDGKEDQVIHLYAQFKPMEKKTNVTYHANYPQNGGDETKTFEALVVNETFEISGPGTLGFTKVAQEKDGAFVFRASNGCEFRFVRWTNSAGETISGTSSAGREYFNPGQKAAAGAVAENNNLYAVWEVVQEYISISGTKTWDDADNQDGMRPDSVPVTLLADDKPASTTPEANGRRNPTPVRANGDTGNVWSYQWTNLPKHNASTGAVIKYTVTENEKDVPAGYTMKPVTGDMEKGFNITNEHTPAKTEVTVTKKWDDGNNRDGIRPETVQVQLYRSGANNNEQVAEGAPVTLNNGNNWSHTWEGLAKKAGGRDITYTVAEVSVPAAYTAEVTGGKDETNDGVFNYTITNTHEPEVITVSGKKTWNDADNQDGKRPDSITITLFADGEEVATTVEANGRQNPTTVRAEGNSGNVWSYSWTNLPKYAAGKNGVEIQYTVQEAAVEGYNAKVDGVNITNEHKPETITISGEKIWDDAEDQDGKRPDSITVNLRAEGKGEPVDSMTVTAEDNWKYEFTDLPKYENGEEIQYSVEEIEVDGYVITTTKNATGGFDIANKHVPETITISGEKIWDDAENQDGKRPESITVNLIAEGKDEPVDSVTVTAENAWKYAFTDIPKYENGEEIKYSIEEIEIEGYTTTISENAAGGFDITNKHVPEKITIAGEKIWDDAENQDGIRPESITVNLLAEGKRTPVDSVAVTAEDEWKYEFKDLPKYENGVEIVYSVTEDNVDGYEMAIDGNNITNTHKPETIEISGKKTWVDGENQDGIRPGSVTVHLFAGEKKVASAEVTAENQWEYIFTELPKFENGEEIVYSITEDKVAGYETTIDGYDITNTHTPETITISGKKTWNDKDDQDGERPKSITVRLLADEKEVKSVTVRAADDWSYAFADMPKYANGTEIKYSVTEDAISGYSTEITDFDITNSYTPKQTSVTVTKSWDDANNQDGIRPKSVKVQLYADGVAHGEAVTLPREENGETSWTYTWTELDERKGGKKIAYTVQEVSGFEGYTKVVSDNAAQGNASETAGNNAENSAQGTTGNNAEDGAQETAGNGEAGYTAETTGNAKRGFTITNAHTPEETAVSVEKIWNDANNQDGIRPESVIVNLYANDAFKASAEVKAADDWKYTFENLPKNQEGKAITYTVKENEVKGYTTAITGDAEEGFKITNTHEPETLAISVAKSWDDADNQDGKRPAAITVNLLADGSVVRSEQLTAGGEAAEETGEETDDNAAEEAEEENGTESGWRHTFKDLPKYAAGQKIQYTVTEEAIAEYDEPVIAGSVEAGFTITNKHTPETVSVSGTKTWNDADNQDGIRPTNVTVNLLADGVKTDSATVPVPEEGTLTYAFNDLPKYKDGKEIKYTVSEEPVTGYTAEISGDVATSFAITNTHIPETTKVSVTKIWDDTNNQDGKRPAQITVNLYADGGNTPVATATVTTADDWKYEFTDLPKYRDGGQVIQYTVTEEAVAEYDEPVITGSAEAGFTITNKHTPETVEVSGTKTWNDADNQDGKRPDSITVNLLADGEKVKSATVTETGGWKYAFTGLPKYAAGTEIVYTVTEDAISEYETQITGYDITNSYTPKETSVTVTKRWDDANNQDGIRPESNVTIQLLADGKEYATVTLPQQVNGESSWTHTWTNLPEKKAGQDITYSVKEVGTFEGYTMTGITGDAKEGFVVTNKHDPATIDISGTKTWNDHDDQDGKRPDSIKVKLLANGEEVQSADVKEVNGEWKFEFNNLPEFEAGAKIAYTITEEAVDGYETEITGDAAAGFSITNTHTPETIDIEGTKTWDDNNNQDGKRPESITVRLLADGTEVDSATVAVPEGGTFAFEFNDLPKYQNGKEIK
ncbi:MAG: Cna B-type domain-containing protein, partial [Lachnospiraceae bacterium]|nr:Cna B-type domain-containing protein [Lachnospiraceae bacterium]